MLILKRLFSTAVLLLSTSLASLPAGAAIILYAEYHLGEPGSLGTNNRPQDSSGNAHHLTTDISGSAAVTGTAV